MIMAAEMEQSLIRIARIDHPLRREVSRFETLEFRRGMTVEDAVSAFVPVGADVAASLNGRLVSRDFWAVSRLSPGDRLVVVPQFGDGDGKSIFRMILMIAVTAASMWAGPWLMGFTQFWGNTMLTSLLTGGLILAGGLIVNALLPPSVPSPSIPDSNLNTQHYSWNPQNTQAQGVPIPRWYGTHRIYGNIISSYIESMGTKQYLNALICLGLGPIQRLRDFRINDQPAKNFPGVQINTSYGYLNQAVMKGFTDAKTEYSMSVQVLKDSPFTYTTIGDDYEGLEIEITFPQGLNKVDGNTIGKTSVNMKIEVRKQGVEEWTNITAQVDDDFTEVLISKASARWSLGRWEDTDRDESEESWWDYQAGTSNVDDHAEGDPGGPARMKFFWRWVSNERVIQNYSGSFKEYAVITGKSTQPIRRTFTHSIDDAYHGIHEIKVTRLTNDHPAAVLYRDATYLTTVREVYSHEFSYPRQALVAVRAEATDKLSGSLRFSCLGDMAVVRVWDGAAWSFQFSNNPSWVAFDVLTQPVIGGAGTEADPFSVIRFDGIDPGRIDVAKFLEWAEFCDVQVDDGLGGTEKRITFNGGFDYDTTMWEAVLKVCQVGRAIPVWNGVNLTVAVDKPSDPVNLYTVGNIEESKFKETFLSLDERATEIEIDFVNRDAGYERDKMTVYRTDVSVNQFKASLDLFGITKPSEAWRAGMHRLLSNRYLIRTVEIDLDIEAINATIGDVVLLQHDVPRWNEGGRLVLATPSYAVLDKEVEIEAGKDYRIIVRMDDDQLAERTVVNLPGKTDTIAVSVEFPSTPGDPYALYQQKITIDPSKISGALTDFTVAIEITDPDNPIFIHTRMDGLDITVVNENGLIRYPHELSVFDTTAKKIVIYFKAPIVSPTENVFYLRYGTGAAAPVSDPVTVWDSNFAAVYHFEEDPAEGRLKDSTGSHHGSCPAGTIHTTKVAAAGVGSAWEFDGTDFVTVAPTIFAPLPVEVTVEIVCRITNMATWGPVLIIPDAAGGGGQLFMGWANWKNGFLSEFYNPSQPVVTMDNSKMEYVSTSAKIGDYEKLYMNASLQKQVAFAGWNVGYVPYNGTYIGGMLGIIPNIPMIVSEIRVSDAVRSPGWMTTTYKNLMDHAAFFSLDAEETLVAPEAGLAVKKYDIYAFGEADRIKKPYRIIGISKTQDQKCTLTLIEYREEVYTCDDYTPPFGLSDDEALIEMQPQNVRLVEYGYACSIGVVEKSVQITYTLSADPDFSYLEVWYRKARANSPEDWIYSGRGGAASYTLYGVERGNTNSIALLPVDVNGNKLHIDKATIHQITISNTKRAGDLALSDGTDLDTYRRGITILTAPLQRGTDADGSISLGGPDIFDVDENGDLTLSESGDFDPDYELDANGDVTSKA